RTSSYSTPSSSPVAFLIARSITSFDMLADRPLSMALRRRGLPAGSPPPARAATEISRMILVKILPRRASSAFLRASMEGPLPIAATCKPVERRGFYPCRSGACAATGEELAAMAAPTVAAQAPLLQEAALAQEGDGLGGGVGREQQAAVAAFDDHVVGDPLQPCLDHGHGAVVVA